MSDEWRCERCNDVQPRETLVDCIQCAKLVCPGCTATKEEVQGDEFSATYHICNACLEDMI